MFFYGLYLALKSRSFVYWSPANPVMKHGGVMGVPKNKLQKKIDSKYIPKSALMKLGETMDSLKTKLSKSNIKFPLIAKPNIGERGKVVEKLNNESELRNYLEKIDEDVLFQEYIDYRLELGILYYRFPNEDHGHISSVVRKGFLEINGDGHSTIKQLIDREIRAIGRQEYLKEKFKDDLQKVLGPEESLLLEPIGNHNRGTAFFNGNHLINNDLEKVFDKIALNIEGFYYGRFDIKTTSYEDLYKGENIKILELNGVSSEPAHIYDPKMNLIGAYKEIIKHMRIIYKISSMNNKKGIMPSSAKSFLSDLILHFKRNKHRKQASSH